MRAKQLDDHTAISGWIIMSMPLAASMILSLIHNEIEEWKKVHHHTQESPREAWADQWNGRLGIYS